MSTHPFNRRSGAAAAIFLLALAANLSAQSNSATLRGTTLAAGEPVVGVAVTAREEATGVAHATTSNQTGAFVFPSLPPGAYTVQASADGYAPIRTAPITVHVNDRRQIPLTLQRQQSESSDIVVHAASALQIDTAVSTVVGQRFVADLPLNGRSFQNLIAMTPGVVQSAGSRDLPGGFAVNGMRSTSTYFTVDGVSAGFGLGPTISGQAKGGDGSLPALSVEGGTNSLVAVDSMREFKILSSSYAPESGRGNGAQMAIATRSGTSSFHGSLFHYFRNDKLDANDWFSNRDGLERPATRQNDFGGAVGGPLQRDRTFVFAAYEGFRLRQPQFVIHAYPTLAARAQAAPNIKPFVDAYPVPNREEIGGGLGRFAASFSTPSSMNAYSGRVDHAFGSGAMLFGRYSEAPSFQIRRGSQSSIPSAVNLRSPRNASARTATVGLVHMIGPRSTHEARFNYSRASSLQTVELDGFGGGAPLDIGDLLPSAQSPDESFVAALAQNLPAVAVGRQHDNRQGQWAWSSGFTFLAGRHELRFGGDVRYLAPTFEGSSLRQVGVFAALDGPFGMLGGRAALEQIANFSTVALLSRNASAYLQDSWRPSARLLLNYGLRWDDNSPPSGRNGLTLRPLVQTDDPSAVRLGRPGDPLYSESRIQFAPRIGTAYRIATSQGFETILRAGFGVFYGLPEGAGSAFFSSAPQQRIRVLVGRPFPTLDPALTQIPPSVEPPYGQLKGFDPAIESPLARQWNLVLDQGLGAGRLSLGWVGSAGRRLWMRELVEGDGSRFEALELLRSQASSDYHSLQASYEHRLGSRLQALTSYTWSHSIDTASDSAQPFDPGPRASARGPSDFDVRHLLSGAVSYVLPNAPGGWGGIGRGWGLDGLFRVQSAMPLDVLATDNFVEVEVRRRPDLVPGERIWLQGSQYPGGRALNRAAFQPVDSGQGSLGRNALRAFPLRQLDLALWKRFTLGEGRSLQLRLEAFNTLNTANFAAPVSNLLDPMFGRSVQSYGRGLAGGWLDSQSPLHAAGGPRSVQLSLRLFF